MGAPADTKTMTVTARHRLGTLLLALAPAALIAVLALSPQTGTSTHQPTITVPEIVLGGQPLP